MGLENHAGLSTANQITIKRRLSHLLRNPSEVEDVMQDTYLRILEYRNELKEIANLPAFFSRTANNIAIDRIRRHHRTDRIFVASEESEEVVSQLMRVCCRDPRADDLLESKEALTAVMATITELPEKCGRAYLLSCADELTYAEIAVEVGVTVSMIEKYVARARRHVRNSVAPIYPLNS